MSLDQMYLNVIYHRQCRTHGGLGIDTGGLFRMRIFVPTGLLVSDIVIGVIILHLHNTLIAVLINLDIAVVFVHGLVIAGIHFRHDLGDYVVIPEFLHFFCLLYCHLIGLISLCAHLSHSAWQQSAVLAAANMASTVMILSPIFHFLPFLPTYSALLVTRFPLVPLHAARTATQSPDKSPDKSLDHSAVNYHMPLLCSPQHHHLTHYGLPTHDALFLDHQLMMELYLELPAHCQLMINLTIYDHIIL